MDDPPFACYQVEPARSSRSMCRAYQHCLYDENKIPKGELRIGRHFIVAGSTSCEWYHARCLIREMKKGRIYPFRNSVDDFEGYQDLSCDHQNELKADLVEEHESESSEEKEPPSWKKQKTSGWKPQCPGLINCDKLHAFDLEHINAYWHPMSKRVRAHVQNLQEEAAKNEIASKETKSKSKPKKEAAAVIRKKRKQ